MNENQLKRILELIQKVRAQSRQLGEDFPFEEFEKVFSTDDLRSMSIQYEDTFNKLNDQFSLFKDLLDGIENDIGGITVAITKTIQELGKTQEPVNLVFRSLRSIRNISQKLASDQRGDIELTSKEVDNLSKKFKEQLGVLEGLGENGGASLDEVINKQQETVDKTTVGTKEYDKQLEKLNELKAAKSFLVRETGKDVAENEKLLTFIEKALQATKAREERLKDISGLTGSVAKSTNELLKTIGLSSLSDFLDFESIDERINKKAKEIDERITDQIKDGATPSEQRKLKRSASLEIVEEGFKGVGKSISKVFTDIGTQIALVAKGILFIFNQIKDAFISVDTEAGKLAKTFNVTYQEALAIRNELVESARASNELFVTSKALQETLSQINLSVGTRSFTGLNEQVQQSVVFLTKLREQAGLSAESLGRVAELSFATGESAEDLTKTLLGSVEVFAAREGLILNEKQVFEEIQNLSDATLLSLSRTPSEIGKAVVEARKLGASLSQIEGISESLVNFQSSIESELQAQVLTGRALNLNAARLFALNNDTAGVAREISSQIGSAAEFADLNRIQQKGVADAIGVGRDELAKMLIVQEQIAGLQTDEAEKRQKVINSLIEQRGIEGTLSAIGDGQLDKLEKQASVQEQFTASVNKLKEVFVDIATIIGPLLSGVASIVGQVAKLVSLIPGELLAIGGAALTGFVASGFNPIGAAVGAGVGLAGTLVNDGYFPPMEGEEGYDRALLTPEGTFRINNSDNIIAGTDSSLRPRIPRTGYTTQITPITNVSNTTTQPISSQNVTNSTTTQANIDTSELVAAMKKSNELIEQQTKVLSQGQEAIRKQKQVLQVGATDFGTQLNTNSYSVQFG